ncbi:MAG TPA: hypothetical protein VGO07_03370 [Candidatus Saccharimonadales bacterium]|jgi:hypothetical protein|nr:hypothetical protein [Candidatus Saccharimonadales bacterium]
MADRQFDSNQRPRPVFTRSADGRLRPASQGSDIGDVWAEQRRIPLAEAIEQDKLKAAKKAKKQKGRFFNRREITGVTPVVKPKASQPKEIALTISLPGLPDLSKLRKLLSPAVIYKKLPKPGKKPLLIGGSVMAVAIVGFSVYNLVGNKPATEVSSKNRAGVLSANNQAVQTPEYPTILPKSKNIAELGGWGRVSPPDKDPVFAYADTLNSVKLTVSEQPLPANFKTNLNDEISKLAKQFSADDKLAVNGDIPAYVGTSHLGPQSAIVAKHDLLVLIKSESKLSDPQWVGYINSLQ